VNITYFLGFIGSKPHKRHNWMVTATQQTANVKKNQQKKSTTVKKTQKCKTRNLFNNSDEKNKIGDVILIL